MKKKTVLVETSKQGKSWSIKVTSSDAQFRNELSICIQRYAHKFNLQILNASDPFGDTISKRKRKIHKPVMGPATNREEVLE